jgi:hypothetical protein
VLLLDGDADFICNYMGFESMVGCFFLTRRMFPDRLFQVDAMQTNLTTLYKEQQWGNWTVNGIVAGIYKNAGTLSYLRVYQAGHEVSDH